jgi:hypothetical protein
VLTTHRRVHFQQVYNLTVNHLHTYYIHTTTGANLLVHNCGGAVEGAKDAAGSAEQYVYRVHGGGSGPMGHSWTPTNPMTMANPRNELGFPKGNSGQRLSRARGLNRDGVTERGAEPLDGTDGGAPEWLFPDPASQLEVHWTIPLVPPW